MWQLVDWLTGKIMSINSVCYHFLKHQVSNYFANGKYVPNYNYLTNLLINHLTISGLTPNCVFFDQLGQHLG